ncbi:MAG: cation diffusion facilitator family transporter [Rhizobacter sp.]|nr:cation diffusion facilitator family transporter [Rhizobacter sp.]
MTRPPLSIRAFLRISIVAALVTIVMKGYAWHVTGSVGLLSDAMESFVNLAAAIFGLVMVTIAEAPADHEHPYGHSKAEYFSSGFEGLLILGASLAILWTAVHRFADPQPVGQLDLGLALSIGSSAINGVLGWAMLRAARHHDSIALEADARHLFTDVWTSVGVVVGLVLVRFTGWLWLDPVLAIAVALNILAQSWQLVSRSVDGLMDRALSDEDLKAIDDTLRELADGDVRFDHVRTRRAAQRRFCQLHMHVPSAWTLGRAASRRADAERALAAAVRGLRVTIELLPVGVEPEQVPGA